VTDDQERTKLEQRLKQGEWLKTGAVAKLLGVGRTKVHTLVTRGVIGHRKVPGGVQRLCNPADVRRLLEESRQEHRGEPGDDTED